MTFENEDWYQGLVKIMVNPAKIEGLVRTLRQYLAHLENLQKLGQDTVRSDPYKRGAARYYLQVSIFFTT